jgi:putative transposase
MHKEEFTIEKMCKVLSVSKSVYYKWIHRKPSQRAIRNALLLNDIRRIYTASKRRYGSPRITKEIQAEGTKSSKPLIAKLMRKENIQSIIRKKYRVTTNSNHKYPVVANKLMQNFTVDNKNEVWVSDITYVATKEGWLYLTAAIDLYDRKVIGWALSSTIQTTKTSIAAFKMTVINRPIDQNKALIFHSDRGVQYACHEFAHELKKQKCIIRSMSRKGNCWDNAVAESFFKTLKVELVYHNTYQTRKHAVLSIFEYIETWYNQKRRHKHLNNLTILEQENLMNTNQLKQVA